MVLECPRVEGEPPMLEYVRIRLGKRLDCPVQLYPYHTEYHTVQCDISYQLYISTIRPQ